MVDVSEELKDAFLSHTQKDIQLSFTDTSYNLTGNDLKLEEAILEQSICDETILTFGKCSSSCFTFTMKNNNKSYKNLEFDVTLTAYDFEGNSYPLSLGHYIVYEDTVSDDRNYRSIVAYDKLKAVMQTDYKDWYHSLTFPMSLKAFRDAFFLHIGINQESKVLINDDFIVKDTINADVLTGQTIIEAICELNCAFGNIGYDGNFRYVTFVQDAGLYPRDDLYPSDELYPDDPNVSLSVTDANYLLGTFVYQDYYCQKIDSVRIIEDKDDDGTVVGTGDNQYTISGNFLIFGSNETQRQTIGQRFLEFCEDFFYTPTKIEMWGQPWLEVGDLVQVIGKTTALVFPILHRTLSGITALKDSYEAQGSETYVKASNTLSSQFAKYRSKTMKMERTVDRFYQEYKEFEADTDGTLESHSSRIQQNATNISSEVSRATGAEGNLSSLIQQNADQIVLKVDSSTGKIAQVKLGVSASSGSEFKVQADNLDLSANDVFNIMSGGTLNLNSKNITIQSDTLTIDRYGNITSTYGGYSAKLSSASLRFYISDSEVAIFRGAYWQGTTVYGTALNSPPSSNFISFGNKNSDSDPDWITPLVLNYGLDPNGYTQDVLIYGSTLIRGETTISNRIYNSNGDYIGWLTGGGHYFSSNVGIAGNLQIDGNITSPVRLLNGEYLNSLVGGGIYASSKLSVDGEIIAKDSVGNTGKVMHGIDGNAHEYGVIWDSSLALVFYVDNTQIGYLNSSGWHWSL